MILQTALLFIIIPGIFPYYFYNPLTHDILTRSSLTNPPKGYKLIPPPKSNGRKFKRGNKSGQCMSAGFICRTPFDKSTTFQYECVQDDQCPVGYKCCEQNCFTHKICSRSTAVGIRSTGRNTGRTNTRCGTCEKWPYSCQKPYDYAQTSFAKCTSDGQCPKGFKCCEQTCFLHKICSRARTSSVEINPTTKPSIQPSTTEENYGVHENEETDTEEPEEENYDDDTNEGNVDDIDVDYQTEEPEEETYENNVVGDETTDASTILQIEEDGTAVVTTTTVDTADDVSEAELELFSEEPEDYLDTRGMKKRKKNKHQNSNPDNNEIIPEYSEYYYHYGEGNDTSFDYEYEEEEK